MESAYEHTKIKFVPILFTSLFVYDLSRKSRDSIMPFYFMCFFFVRAPCPQVNNTPLPPIIAGTLLYVYFTVHLCIQHTYQTGCRFKWLSF